MDYQLIYINGIPFVEMEGEWAPIIGGGDIDDIEDWEPQDWVNLGNSIYAEQREKNYEFAQKLIPEPTPEQVEWIAKLKQLGMGDAEIYQNVQQQMLGQGGKTEDLQSGLGTLNQTDFERRYDPAFQRLMADYQDMDRGIIEDMNRRGITSIGSSDPNMPVNAGSEPEMYQRNLLSRETKREMGNLMKEAQSQSMAQRTADLGVSTSADVGKADRLARLGNQAYGGFSQAYNQTAIGEAERTRLKAGIASQGAIAAGQGISNFANAGVNSSVESDIASNQSRNQMIGAGVGALSTLGGAAIQNPGGAAKLMSMFGSSRELKENIRPHSDESALARLMQTEPKEWNYKGETQTNIGPIAEETPEPIATPDHKAIDLNNYLSELTGAVRALAKRVHGSGLQGVPQS